VPDEFFGKGIERVNKGYISICDFIDIVRLDGFKKFLMENNKDDSIDM
jgi:hypothetical protein